MAEIIRAERRADGAVAVTVREEREVVIQPKDAVKPKADLRALPLATQAAIVQAHVDRAIAAAKAEWAWALNYAGHGTGTVV